MLNKSIVAPGFCVELRRVLSLSAYVISRVGIPYEVTCRKTEQEAIAHTHVMYAADSWRAVLDFAERCANQNSQKLVDAWLETGDAPQDIHQLVDFVLQRIVDMANEERV